MKITIYIGGLTGGGAERVCCNLASFLVERGHEVTMLTVSAQGKTSYPLDQRVVLKTLETAKRIKFAPLRIAKKQLNLLSFVRKHETDVYLVMLPKTIRSLMAFKRFIKAPIVFSERANPPSYDVKTQKNLRKAASLAEGIVFQTEDAKDWYLPSIKNKWAIIPNAVNPDFIRPKYTGEKEKSIVAAGRLSGEKNFGMLLDAFADISPEYPEYTLKIFGKGPLKEALSAKAEGLNISDKVKFMGYVSDMPEQLERAAAFVLSSNFEGMPNALMEAMALGLPCVSTDCPAGGPKFLIKDGENGLLVPVGDSKKTAEAIRRVLSDESLAEKLGNNARELAKELAPDRIYGMWEEFLKGIARKG